MYVEVSGAINGTTAYSEGQLVGREVTVSLPEVTPVIAEVQAMGTMEVPLIGLIDSMEASIKRIGVDMGLVKICKPESKTIEFRWVQNVTKADGSNKSVGCKAFLRVIPKVILPGADIEPGSSVETEIPLSTTRYQLFVDGKELLCIDRLSQIFRIDGKDYYGAINNLL